MVVRFIGGENQSTHRKPQTNIPTYLSSSLPSEHKVATRLRHPVLSLAFVSASPQVMPSSFSSDTIVLHQVVLGLPLCLFPWGVHLRAILVILDTGILRTCPSHLKRLCCISLRTHVEVPMRFYHSPGLQIYICTLFVETIFKKN